MAVVNTKVTLSCSVGKIWNKITNLSDFSWRSDLKEIIIIDNVNFIEISKNGIKTNFKITAFEKHKFWAFDIENENIKGSWVGKFHSHGEKTTLDFIENIVAKKWIFNLFIAFYLKKQQKIYFRDLKKALDC